MAERRPKPIILVHPDAATTAVTGAMKRAGYAVIVTDAPAEQLRAVDLSLIGSLDVITKAALETISGSRWADTQENFGKRVADLLLANRKLMEAGDA